ncbi:MAG: hypothetical protein KUG73_13575 [Pseudomonadales bacterium]|nr:hypothetical protein [Pseudomonadales bacterium]
MTVKTVVFLPLLSELFIWRDREMESKFENLVELHAVGFQHLDGSLIDHLKGTQEILEKWGASISLQDAGLYHAAYGTAGFSQSLVSTDQREKIADVIGATAEEIVYQYCASDRETFFSRIGRDLSPIFPNRFTGESYVLSERMLRDFCELTAANEIEISIDNPKFLDRYGAELNDLFIQMAPYLSDVAQQYVAEIFGVCSA